MNNLNNKIYQYFLLLSLLIFSTFLKALELDNIVQESISETISQVNNIDLGEAESDLALGIDQAMDKMGEGMEFALESLGNDDATTALATMEMLEATMDMALGEIPKEEFMDFSKLKLDDFSPEELASAQSMMGDMMAQSMGDMTDMMENMSHVKEAGFDMSGFMGTMDQSGFGFETMFTDNMESMGAMFGEDMSMMGMMDGMDMSSEMMTAFTMDPGSMDMGEMMENMGEMEDMSSMMSEHMDFGNFADMAGMMDDSQMEMMTDGMKEMMSKGSFDSFAGNITAMGVMIKGEGPEGMKEEGQESFFAPSDKDANMMEMMSNEMDHMGEAFNEMSEEQMGSFIQDMGEPGAIMNLGDMADMGMEMGDMAGMAMDMNMDMGDMGMGHMGMGDMGMGGMGMGDMGMGDMGMGDMGMGGMDMGDMGMGDMMHDMGDTMKEAFGDPSGEGGMFTEKHGDFGKEIKDGKTNPPQP